MSRRNPFSRSASSPNVEEKNFALFLLMLDAQKRPLLIMSPFESYIRCQKFTSTAETEKNGTWEVTDIAKRRVKHHPFHHCRSRFFRDDDDLQCALYSTLYSGRFQRKFCESRRKVGTIPYRTVRMISSAGPQRSGSWNCDWGRSALSSSVRVS